MVRWSFCIICHTRNHLILSQSKYKRILTICLNGSIGTSESVETELQPEKCHFEDYFFDQGPEITEISPIVRIKTNFKQFLIGLFLECLDCGNGAMKCYCRKEPHIMVVNSLSVEEAKT